MAIAPDATVASMYEVSRKQFNDKQLERRLEWASTLSIDACYIPAFVQAMRTLHESDRLFGTAPLGGECRNDAGVDVVEFIDRHDIIAFSDTARVYVTSYPPGYQPNEDPYSRVLIRALSKERRIAMMRHPRISTEDLMDVFVQLVSTQFDPEYKWSPLLFVPMQITFTLASMDVANVRDVTLDDGVLTITLTNRSDEVTITIDLVKLKKSHDEFNRRRRESDA